MNAMLLKQKMKEKGMPQYKLAKRIGISENSLSRKLLGKRDFRLGEIIDICRVLEIKNPKLIFFDDFGPNSQREGKKQ